MSLLHSFTPKKRLAETEFFIGFLRNAFQDFPNFEKVLLLGDISYSAADSRKRTGEKQEALSSRERMRGSKVRYFYYLLRVSSPFIFPLQSVLPPFFPLGSLF